MAGEKLMANQKQLDRLLKHKELLKHEEPLEHEEPRDLNKIHKNESIRQEGVYRWNLWRASNFGNRIDLCEADLSHAYLKYADLSEVDLSYADLRGAHLEGANLNYADLRGAHLEGANLIEADLKNTNLSNSNLRHAGLSRADLENARLSNVNLSQGTFSRTDFSGANLNGADLSSSYLINAYLHDAVLSEADLNRTYLVNADLSRALLNNTNLREAEIGYTVFGDVDLSTAIGLETVKHIGPSTIGIDTIIRSKGKIPEIFLRNAGVPDAIIEAIPSLLGSLSPVDYYSCFISYSSKDQAFAERLYADLQSKGVRCWYAPEDLKWSAKISSGIDEAIRLHDKLLLILSKSSVASGWVEREVKTALTKERKEKRTVLFPVRVDRAVFESPYDWATEIRHERNIGDFTRWKNHDDYEKAFSRLLRDLKAEAMTG
jgi:uncharacterized protein YjbI with pentapeptide repeats